MRLSADRAAVGEILALIEECSMQSWAIAPPQS
jgi:hypothetical protein